MYHDEEVQQNTTEAEDKSPEKEGQKETEYACRQPGHPTPFA